MATTCPTTNVQKVNVLSEFLRGCTLVESKQDFGFWVHDRHVNKAVAGDCERCVLALAARERPNVTKAIIGIVVLKTTAYIKFAGKPDLVVRFKNGALIQRLIPTFDLTRIWTEDTPCYISFTATAGTSYSRAHLKARMARYEVRKKYGRTQHPGSRTPRLITRPIKVAR